MSEDIQSIIIELVNSVIEETYPDFMKEVDVHKDLSEYELNSISFILVTVAIENRFHIEFDEEALGFETLRTIEDLTNYVKERIS